MADAPTGPVVTVFDDPENPGENLVEKPSWRLIGGMGLAALILGAVVAFSLKRPGAHARR